MQDARALAGKEHVPDGVEERDGALDLVQGYGLALDGGKLVAKLSHAVLELVGLFIELG